ncbi:DUF4040 domain-containing protein [Candidatus Endowatersipora endosymbiont of Watersipora subatra]|uniref:DUF4040 domain-containing protein n=1 Tax=Candidatus Endowatersipora endosymbiont of Watersipora subatra TaxID=3077946 RepID=UPI00312C865B
MEISVILFLFSSLVATGVSIVLLRSLFAVVMLSGVFSLLSALLFLVMDAVDVAFTEAAVGGGISSILLLGTIVLTSRFEKKGNHHSLIPLAIVILTGAVLIYGTLDMPTFGSQMAPAQLHIGRDYLQRTPQDINIPNVVTAILASYRSFDTFGEIIVVLTAGLGVILLLGLGRPSGRSDRRHIRETRKR